MTVGELWILLQNYEKELARKDDHIELYPHLKECFTRSIPDSDPEGTVDGTSDGAGEGAGDGAGDGATDGATEGAIDRTAGDADSDREGIDSEPAGCAPGEVDNDESPDYRIDTP